MRAANEPNLPRSRPTNAAMWVQYRPNIRSDIDRDIGAHASADLARI